MPPPRVPLKGRMTANPARIRYRAGKGGADSTEEEEPDDDEELEESEPEAEQKKAPPKATSFPSQVKVRHIDPKQRRLDQHEEEIRKRVEREDRERMEKEAGFVTESESEEEEAPAKPAAPSVAAPTAGSESEEEDASSSEEASDSGEESSSEDEAPKLLRPIFTKPTHRTSSAPQADTLFATSNDTADTARRKANTDALLQDIGDKRAAEKAARNREWDDDEAGVMDEEAIDDRDGLDEELEHQQWVARELARLKRDRAAMEEREKEIAELERRRNLSTPEREAEDKELLEKQKEEKAGKGHMGFMQKYQHKGAFYQDEGEATGLAKRDLMGARYVDQVEDKEALPEYLRRRDDKKIGKKGATRYKDMRSEDTVQFGAWLGNDRRREGGKDRTGANASALGEKRKGFEGDERPSKKQSILSRY